MEPDHYSKEWDDAPMPHSIFFTQIGHAIHGSLDVKHLGPPASHGCVRLSPEEAATLYELVEAQGMASTQVVVTGSEPGATGPGMARGGEQPRRARPPYPGDQYYAEQPPPPYGWRRQPWWGPGDYEPPRRRGWFFQRPY
jgi:L,D-transpeptidase catalytic domain